MDLKYGCNLQGLSLHGRQCRVLAQKHGSETLLRSPSQDQDPVASHAENERAPKSLQCKFHWVFVQRLAPGGLDPRLGVLRVLNEQMREMAK